MMRAAACALMLAAGPAQALCNLTGEAAAEAVSGTYTTRVIEAVITVAGQSQPVPQPPAEAAVITLAADGTGTFGIKDARVDLTLLAPGTFHLNGRGDRTLAFSKAAEALELDLTALGCPLTDLLQMRAERAAKAGGRQAVVLTDLVMLAPGVLAGVQLTRIAEDGTPDIILLTTMTLERAE